MIVAVIMAALIGLYAAESFYLKKASTYLRASDAPWDRLYDAAKEVVADQHMPKEAVGFAAATVLCAGCGCLTRQFLWDAVTRRSEVRPTKSMKMSEAQRAVFAKVVINAIYYDSLRAPFSGFLLRRLVLPSLKTASEGTTPARRVEVARMVQSSRDAIGHRPEGKRLLAIA